jgi:hypothetical protein
MDVEADEEATKLCCDWIGICPTMAMLAMWSGRTTMALPSSALVLQQNASARLNWRGGKGVCGVVGRVLLRWRCSISGAQQGWRCSVVVPDWVARASNLVDEVEGGICGTVCTRCRLLDSTSKFLCAAAISIRVMLLVTEMLTWNKADRQAGRRGESDGRCARGAWISKVQGLVATRIDERPVIVAHPRACRIIMDLLMWAWHHTGISIHQRKTEQVMAFAPVKVRGVAPSRDGRSH